MKFYTKRCLTHGRDLNLIVTLTYEYALRVAAERDEELKTFKSVKDMPPLFGVPMSLKDRITLKGYDTTVGNAASCFKPDQEDGLVARLLAKAGAIVIVKSNLPQLMLINETHNWLVGRAINPWSKERSTGGSSGGCGGLVALNCVLAAIGTDGGGSVRIPALYNGVTGFKPTAKRVTDQGSKPANVYSPSNVYACIGPLANDVDGCERVMKALYDRELMQRFDPGKVFLDWDRK